MSLRYAYFPGCSAKGSCQELDVSTKAVASFFGIELAELENPGCTGAREFRAVSERLHRAANARILALAEATESDLVVVCDTCLLNLTEVNELLKRDAHARDEANADLAGVGLAYRGTITVKHFLWVLLDDVGRERIREKVVRPLSGLKVAPFYGCHLLRPASVYANGSTWDTSLDTLCELVGAEPVAYEGARQCCGFHVVLAEERIALRMTGAHLGNARAAGADCLVTPCPLCHTMLDAFQPSAERELDRTLGLPVLHVSQLVGLAVGIAPKALNLSRHVVNTKGVLRAAVGR
jgi:succinate dehydrogenase / fumarate reductase cytochrome b subunit